MNAERKIKKSIIELQVDQPFFAFLAMNIKLKKMPDNTNFKTMGVDANFNLYYDEDFVNNVIPSDSIRKGCVCHEVLHVALDHIGRVGTRYKMLANIAQDMVVNMICEKNNLQTLKKPEYVNADASSDTAWIFLDKLGFSKITVTEVYEKSWERVYSEILDILKGQGFSPEDVEKKMTCAETASFFDYHMHESFNKMSKEEQNQVKENLKQMLSDALVYSKQMGKVPRGMERYVTELLNPKIPWNTKLMKHLKSHTEPNDWSYHRPHRKSHNLGIYMPIIKKEHIVIEVIVDTSGSIDQNSYNEFISEVHGMIKVIPNITVYLSFADTEIRKTVVMTKSNINELLTINPSGGGGTDMEYALEQLRDENRNSPFVVVLTDGYTNCDKNGNELGFDILWVICKNGLDEKKASKHFKYGNVIKM